MCWDMCLCGCFILLDTNQSVISGLRTEDMAEYVIYNTHIALQITGVSSGFDQIYVCAHPQQSDT